MAEIDSQHSAELQDALHALAAQGYRTATELSKGHTMRRFTDSAGSTVSALEEDACIKLINGVDNFPCPVQRYIVAFVSAWKTLLKEGMDRTDATTKAESELVSLAAILDEEAASRSRLVIEKAAIEREKAAIEREKAAIEREKAAIERLQHETNARMAQSEARNTDTDGTGTRETPQDNTDEKASEEAPIASGATVATIISTFVGHIIRGYKSRVEPDKSHQKKIL